MNLKNKILSFLFYFLAMVAFGQQNETQNISLKAPLTFHLIDVESGLSHNFINDIEQDSLGFIWVATIDGLSRYDGTKFISFKKESQESKNGLSNNYIQQIQLSKGENLLLATDEGLVTYNPIAENFEQHNSFKKLNKNSVACITQGPEKETIVGMVRYKEGLHIINKKGKLESYEHLPKDKNSLSSNNVTSLKMQGDSILWVGTHDQGLNKFHFKSRKNQRISSLEKGVLLPSINTIYTDKEENVWIGAKSGLHLITAKGDTLLLKSSKKEGTGLSDNNVLAIEEDNNGQMWIGTRNGGLSVFNKQAFLTKTVNFHVQWYLPKSDGTSVFNRTVSTIKKDSDGNMWLGTSTGINFVNPKGEPIQLLQKNTTNTQSLSHNRIGALAQSKNHKIWVGTDGGGLDLLDPISGTIKHYKHQQNNQQSLSNNYVLSLLEDSKERLWVGTYQGGLNKLNKNGSFSKYLQANNKNGIDVRVIFESNDGTIWVGTNRAGLYKYNEKKDVFEYISNLGRIDIRDIEQGQDQKLWLATFGDGIIRFNPENKDYFSINPANTRGLTSDVIFSILPMKNEGLLVGTRHGGIVYLDANLEVQMNLTEADGLSNNTISSIVKDTTGTIWLGTYNGINYFDFENQKISTLNNQNNLQKGEFNIGAALFSSSGLLYFGGNKGLNILKPEKLNQTKKNYPLILENLNILNKPIKVTPNDKKGILQKSLAYQNHIILNHKQTLFSIGYTLLKYPTANNTSYSYQLENYHPQWINNKNAGIVNLSNIPSGEYLLNIKAKTGSNIEVTKQLSITITPPFWKTWPAYLLYVIVLSILLYGFLKYYSERIKLKNSLHFEQKQRQLEQDLNAERIRFFTNFSHELKTPLTLILAPVEDLLLEIKNTKHLGRIGLIQKNAKYLFQTINKLLEFRKSEVGLGELVVGKYNLNTHLNLLVQNYRPLSKKNQIDLQLSLPEAPLMGWLDLEKVQIIINNILSNAFKHCPNNGKIKIKLYDTKDNIEIKIKDTGAGILPNDIAHIFEWYYQSGKTSKKRGSGIGLALSKNLVELHGGKIDVSSKIGKGTKFTIIIPKDRSLFKANIELTSIDPAEEDVSASHLWTPTQLEPENRTIPIKIELSENREVLLLIDDNPDILQYLESLLVGEYDLIFAENGQIGIEKALQYVPDLIISDIMMPQKSGIDLCTVIKQNMHTSHIPIILLSAKANHESITLGFEEGADDYITKPFNSQVLKTRVHNILDNRKKLRQHFSENQTDDTLTKEQTTVLEREKMFLKKLEDIILKNITIETTNVDAIAAAIGMSRSSLFRKLKAICGYNINTYIRIVKLKKAAHLIKNEDFNITQAAYEVGFKNQKYFRKLFKEQFGVLPSEYGKVSERQSLGF